MTIDTKTLRRFCNPKDERIPNLMGIAGGTAACDGNVLVWISTPLCYGPPAAQETRERFERIVALANKIAAASLGTWSPVAGIQFEAFDCWRCKGAGYAVENPCNECDGEGEFWHGSHKYVCQECEGDGAMVRPAREDVGTRCEVCVGSGLNQGVTDFVVAGQDNLTVSRIYAKLLRELPSAELRHEHVTLTKENHGYLVGRFDGGVFVLAAYKDRPQIMPGTPMPKAVQP